LGAAFTSGQVYVALSRCTSFSGLVLKTQIGNNAIKTDPQVLQFAQNETPSTLIVQELNSGKADFYYKKVREEIKSLNFTEAYDNFVKAIKFRNDIETDLFKKYFVVTAIRLGSFRKKQTDTLNELVTKTQENEELQVSISELESEKLSQQTKINDQNKAIKLLLDKTKDLEKQSEKLKSDISSLTTEKANTERTIQQNQKTIQGNKATISQLETTIKSNEREIERLRNLKWYQKLFGQK
jgi:chromosome segregation ATPase